MQMRYQIIRPPPDETAKGMLFTHTNKSHLKKRKEKMQLTKYNVFYLKYLFIWRSDDPDDDLGEYFQEILNHLKAPLLHSMEAFLLPDSHDRIRSFREALRSGPGLMVKRERAKELDFWEWEISRVKDLSAHKIFREKIGLADRSRWLTGWDTRGR
ncbi:MAG: hypothetical protein ACI8RD_008204 [Bacillariaceae sp.]|jgi:hypothetical protein